MNNAQLSGAYYGVPVPGIRPAAEIPGSRLASASGPYLGRGNFCSANDDTCTGRKAKGTDLCMGHLRSAGEA
jgi:hypothetical protein